MNVKRPIIFFNKITIVNDPPPKYERSEVCTEPNPF